MKAVESWADYVERKGLKRNKIIKMKDITRKGKHLFRREAFMSHPQCNHPEKQFTIERLMYLGFEGKNKDISNPASAVKGGLEYRIAYYIVGKNGTKKGKWTFGQFCPMIPAQDLAKLLLKAKNDGVLLPE